MTTSPSPDARARPWPIYTLAALVGLCAAGLTIGVLVLPRSSGGRFVLQGEHYSARRALGLDDGLHRRDTITSAGPVSSHVAWTPDLGAMLRSADPVRGALVASNCSACHGPDGIGGSELAPSLAAQPAPVLWKQLQDFRSGTREWPVMNAVARALGERDMAAVARYLSDIRLPAARCAVTEVPAPSLVNRGDIKRLIPPCAACHESANSNHVPMFAPRLDGQRADYLERQLLLFRAAWRRNDIYGHMRVVARPLDDVEIRQLARWYSATESGEDCSSKAAIAEHRDERP